LQIATALRAGAAAMLTNDPAFARVREIEIGVLDQLR
jgi:predicted nucleic acid-binding protein